MDSVFVQGIAGFIAGILIFCGSIWLLMALVMGARLAYYVSASVTLAFILIMGAVWSYGTPLGPVGQLPSWESLGISASAEGIEFNAASTYPEGEWRAPDDEDAQETTQTAELEGDAIIILEEAIADEKIEGFADAQDAQVDKELTRLIEVDGVTYGAVTIIARDVVVAEEDEEVEDVTEGPDTSIAVCDDKGENCEVRTVGVPAPSPTVADVETTDPKARAIVVMKYDPGNPLGKARMITAGTFLLLAAHLFGLSRAERKAKARSVPEVA